MRTQSRRYFQSQAPQEHVRACDHEGCTEAGEYRAPKSRTDLQEYFWFCLEHVRAYNASWDYYAGMSMDEIEAEIRFSTTWQRPTWKLGEQMAPRRVRIDLSKVKDPFGLFEEELEAARKAAAAEARRRETPEDAAMRVMELQAPLTKTGLKSRYKELVKRYHPDANGGDKAAEERFKEVSQAYKVLMTSLNP